MDLLLIVSLFFLFFMKLSEVNEYLHFHLWDEELCVEVESILTKLGYIKSKVNKDELKAKFGEFKKANHLAYEEGIGKTTADLLIKLSSSNSKKSLHPMIIAIDLGHGCPPDTGAVGIRKEDDLIEEVGRSLIKKLEDFGHICVDVRPGKAKRVGDSLSQRCQKANFSGAKYFISLHFNAFNGKASGTEVFAISNPGRRLALSVVNEIASLGFKNRGVKNGSHLFVLRNTNMPAILIEGCFIDSQEDITIYKKEQMSQAIFDGLTKVLT